MMGFVDHDHWQMEVYPIVSAEGWRWAVFALTDEGWTRTVRAPPPTPKPRNRQPTSTSQTASPQPNPASRTNSRSANGRSRSPTKHRTSARAPGASVH